MGKKKKRNFTYKAMQCLCFKTEMYQQMVKVIKLLKSTLYYIYGRGFYLFLNSLFCLHVFFFKSKIKMSPIIFKKTVTVTTV